MATGRRLLLVAAVVLGGSAHADQPAPSIASTQPVAAARAWLAAARAKDVDKLAALSRAPFIDAHVRARKCSFKGPARTTNDLPKLAACVTKHELLVESIPQQAESFFDWKAIPLAQVEPKRYRTQLAPLAADHSFVTGSLAGDGITYTLVMAVRRDGGIDAVLAEAEAVE